MQENIVKQVYKEFGITQKELVEKLGVHLTTVQKWAGIDEVPNNAKKALNYLWKIIN